MSMSLIDDEIATQEGASIHRIRQEKALLCHLFVCLDNVCGEEASSMKEHLIQLDENMASTLSYDGNHLMH